MRKGYDWGIVDGVATNPSLLKKAVEKQSAAEEALDLKASSTQISEVA